MTTAAESVELTRVGPGTAMGQLMREYWMPALKSSELERDGAPLRLMLLGEKLIAFRDSAGRVGVMDHRCPHRCASLFLGRNEEGGLRCIYHGWKFDVTGKCLDMPNVPPQQDFKHKVRAKAYRAVERAGLVWVYMGARAEAPPLPGFEVSDVPDDEIGVALDPARLQLSAGAGGRHRHLAFRLSARRPRRRRRARRGRSDPPHRRHPHAGLSHRRRRPGARRMRAIALPAPAAPHGVSAISCFRSGRRCRMASSPVMCRCAAGCRSTMSTPCTVCCGGSAASRP